jgi:hypothetical protein
VPEVPLFYFIRWMTTLSLVHIYGTWRNNTIIQVNDTTATTILPAVAHLTFWAAKCAYTSQEISRIPGNPNVYNFEAGCLPLVPTLSEINLVKT